MTKNSKKFTFIDLFAGIGGIRIAFEGVGGRCVFSSEYDDACKKTYKAKFGEVPYGDITKIDAKDIPDHDILTAGFPCQAFSIIGDRLGLADTRGTLFFEIERILKEKQPRAFMLENVKQLVSHDKGRTFKVILGKLTNLQYYVHYKVLNGLEFGVPQKRERVIIVGFKKNYPFAFPMRKNGKFFSLEEILEPRERIDKRYYITEYFYKKVRKRIKKTPYKPSVWHENKSGNIGIHPFSCALRANGSYNYLLVNGERRLTGREMLRLQGFPNSFKIVVPYTQIRKQAGNSVVIPKIRAVARAMILAMKKDPIKQVPSDLFNEFAEEKIYV